MGLTVPSVLGSQLDSDLFDLSDSQGPTYSFQELKQDHTMQAEQHYIAEPVLDRLPPPRLHTDDEMFDSDMDRKDDDLDLLDVSSNAGGVEDGSITMDEDYYTQAYDNDDLMIDEAETGEEDMLFQGQQQRQQSPILNLSSSTNLDSSEPGPNASQETIGPQTAAADIPLFSFTQADSTNARSISFAATEKPLVPDHSLYEDAPAEVAEVVEETTVETQTPKPYSENTAKPNNDNGSLGSRTPTEKKEETRATPDDLAEDIPTTDSLDLDNDFHHNGGWSENTSTTLAHEPTLLEDQRAFEDEDEEVEAGRDHHVEDYKTETEVHVPTDFATEEFAQYNLHPIVVEWDGNRLSLFPTPNPIAEEGDLEFFIQDPQVCEKGINELFLEFRKVLDESVSQDVELFIGFEGLSLELGEDNVSCNSISLQYILNLHVQLHKQDGTETPDPLRINLFYRPSFSNQITSLVAAATRGMGFSEAVAIIEPSVEDSHMKTEEEHSGIDVQTPNRGPEDDAQHEAHNSTEDQKVSEEKQSTKLENAISVDSNLPTPRALVDNVETIVKDEKGEGLVEAKVEEDDDEEYELDWDIAEADVEPKIDDAKPISEPPTPALETPKPGDATASIQIERTTEILIEEISDGVSVHDPQQPEEIEETDSSAGETNSSAEASHSPSIQEDEELIEYEEDDETTQQPASTDSATKDIDQSVESDESSRSSSTGEDHVRASHSPHAHGMPSPPFSSRLSTPSLEFFRSTSGLGYVGMASQDYHMCKYCDHITYDGEMTGSQKLESPDCPSSRESDHDEDLENMNRSNSPTGTNDGNANESDEISAPKVPSSIPVFHGGDGPGGEYEYVEGQQQQQQGYDGHEYSEQAQQFQTEEQDYGGEHVEYQNNQDDSLQAPDYLGDEDFEYYPDYPSVEQNEYLDDTENKVQGDTDGYDNYPGGDGAYNEFGGEQEHPIEHENEYSEYPHEGYGGDAAYYPHEGFGDIDVGAIEDNEVGKRDHEHSPLPSGAVDILKKSPVIASEVEEEKLIDYEEDDDELAKELVHNPNPQLLKSPGEQKRMREDEQEQNGPDSTGENQGLWQDALYGGDWTWNKTPDYISPPAKRVRSE